jgi:hypothetical protein
VNNQPKITLYANYNAFAKSPQFADDAAFHVRKRRVRGAQEKGARQPYPLNWLTDDAWFQRSDVGGDIGQFWYLD